MSTGGRWGLIWLIIATFFLWQEILTQEEGGKIVFWPGEEDALFIQTREGGQILVNGGREEEILKRLGAEMRPGDKELDLVVLTSGTEERFEGLISVLESYQVNNVLWNGAIGNSSAFEVWENQLEREKTNLIIAKADQEIILGSALLKIFAPAKNLLRYQLKNSVEGEIVWQLEDEGMNFLFLGKAPTSFLAGLDKEGETSGIVEVNSSQESLPWVFWSHLKPSLLVVSGSFTEEKIPLGIPLRQTEKEGKVVINF